MPQRSMVPLEIPPGLVRGGTEYGARGRWYDSSLVRTYEGGAVGPINGWLQRTTSAMTGMCRSILAWKENDLTRWVAMGTHSKLYVINSINTLSDITPAGFAAGRADAVFTTGYGYGPYSYTTYGSARPDTGSVLDATVLDLDQWGENLVMCSPDDGKLYEWATNPAVVAAVITNAPTACRGLVVTPQRFLMALAAGGNSRKVQWCDQELNTVWTPSASNQAGDLEVPTGSCMLGRAVGEETLVLTDLDAHVFTYVGLPYVYGRTRVGTNCGAISKRCIAVAGDVAVWWSRSGFWVYDGSVWRVDCPIWDDLQRDFSLAQISKISAWYNGDNDEFWWHYPCGTATENDCYVFWCRKFNHWYRGSMARTAGQTAGIFANPMVVGTDGYVYDHELSGSSALGGATPFIRSGPFEIGTGDKMMTVLGIVPDEKTAGEVEISFRARNYPTGDETTIAEATLDGEGKSDIRFQARQTEIYVEFDPVANPRFGTPRLIVQSGGRR